MWSIFIFLLLLGIATAPSPFSRTYKGPFAESYAGFSTLGQFGPFGSSSTTPTFFLAPTLGSTNKPNNGIKATDRYNIFDTVYEWNILDYAFESPAHREAAIMSGEFVPENNLPLGIDRWKNL